MGGHLTTLHDALDGDHGGLERSSALFQSAAWSLPLECPGAGRYLNTRRMLRCQRRYTRLVHRSLTSVLLGPDPGPHPGSQPCPPPTGMRCLPARLGPGRRGMIITTPSPALQALLPSSFLLLYTNRRSHRQVAFVLSFPHSTYRFTLSAGIRFHSGSPLEKYHRKDYRFITLSGQIDLQ